MKIVFCYLDFSAGSQGKYYHGLALLSGILKANGFETDLVHVTKEEDATEIARQILERSPDLAAFSTTTNMFPHTAEVAAKFKELTDTPTIVGGIHPTIASEESINEKGFDIVCVGEGEYPLLELVRAMDADQDYTAIKNLWIKSPGGIIKNDLRPLTQDLNELPFPDHELFDYEKLEDAKQHRVVMMASRGCPYECAFCCNHLLKRLYTGKYVRFRAVDNVVEEARELVALYKPEFIVFHDDILTLDKKWLEEFAAKWKQEIGVSFSCNSRVNLLDEEAIDLLAEAGCFEISMGIESGDPKMRETILRRHMTNEQILQAFFLCREHGISTISYNIVGLPFETMTDALETVKLNAKANPDNIQVSIFYPFPHTRLFELCRENGFLTGRQAESYFEAPVISQPGISEDEVRFLFTGFGALVKAYSICYTLPKAVRQPADKLLTWFLKQRLFRKIFESIT